jgi:hypothetical protein
VTSIAPDVERSENGHADLLHEAIDGSTGM